MDMLFIHGAQQDRSCWLAQRDGFAGYRVLAPDLPGHGARATEAALPSIEAQAQWVKSLLDAQGVARAHVVGHSMGSLVALELARRFPDSVRSVTLMGASLPMPVSPALLEAARDNEPKAMDMINNWSFSVPGLLGQNGRPGFWMPGINRCVMARQKRGVLYTDLCACNAYKLTPDSLVDMIVPALVMAGRQDRMTSLRSSRAIAGAMPHARLAVLPGCGHAMMIERPGEVRKVLGEFLRELAVTTRRTAATRR